MSRDYDIAVVGGGIQGLTTAFFCSKFLTKARVTVYESEADVCCRSSRLCDR